MISCRDLVDLVSDYVENRLSMWDRVRFQVHLRMCPQCGDYIRQLELARDALAELPPPTMSQPVREQMLATFRDWKKGELPPVDLDPDELDG